MSNIGTTVLPYQDAGVHVDNRVEDLLGRMELEDKAGLMFHTVAVAGPGGTLGGELTEFGMPSVEQMVIERRMSHFNLRGSGGTAREIAEWTNRVQSLAMETRWGIPATISTDPRNSFTDNPGASAASGAFSQWPEPLGLSACRDAGLVQRAADIARQEYLASGLRLALHPQVDLATEPRWSRIFATFGEDADLTSELVAAYIRGFQGDRLGPSSVATMTKHFPGGGPQKDGEDPHFAYGREQVYPGSHQEYHLRPFKAAIAAGGSQMMPYYGMPVGTELEEVGFAFNKAVITDLLRESLGFTGIVCSDWGLLTDKVLFGQPMPGQAWGLEHLDAGERAERLIHAGIDQFGGEHCPELIVDLVRRGVVAEERIDSSVRRLLKEKFVLGLFDNPFVDVDQAEQIVGCPAFRAEGLEAQRRSVTLLTNHHVGNARPALPLSSGTRVYVQGERPAGDRGLIFVDDMHDADVAVLRLRAPYEPRPGGFEANFHAGSLEFPNDELQEILAVAEALPTVAEIYLDRPAVLGEIAEKTASLLVTFGVNTEVFWDVLTGVSVPDGRLPFDLPRSMEAVRASRSDVPYDTENPVFRFGDGLRSQSGDWQPNRQPDDRSPGKMTS